MLFVVGIWFFYIALNVPYVPHGFKMGFIFHSQFPPLWAVIKNAILAVRYEHGHQPDSEIASTLSI